MRSVQEFFELFIAAIQSPLCFGLHNTPLHFTSPGLQSVVHKGVCVRKMVKEFRNALNMLALYKMLLVDQNFMLSVLFRNPCSTVFLHASCSWCCLMVHAQSTHLEAPPCSHVCPTYIQSSLLICCNNKSRCWSQYFDLDCFVQHVAARPALRQSVSRHHATACLRRRCSVCWRGAAVTYVESMPETHACHCTELQLQVSLEDTCQDTQPPISTLPVSLQGQPAGRHVLAVMTLCMLMSTQLHHWPMML
jgi:hypothetical protein